MSSEIYLPPLTRKFHKRQIQSYVSVYLTKLSPVFGDMSAEADAAAQQYWDDAMQQPASEEADDPSVFADAALEKGINTYQMLSIGRYTLAASWHATLYELFEQQIRLFLYEELQHNYVLQFEKFCTSVVGIRECFSVHGVDLESLACWATIDELRLLCNLIKHADGRSATELRSRNPALFKVSEAIDLLDLYHTTLMEISLNVDEGTIQRYPRCDRSLLGRAS